MKSRLATITATACLLTLGLVTNESKAQPDLPAVPTSSQPATPTRSTGPESSISPDLANHLKRKLQEQQQTIGRLTGKPMPAVVPDAKPATPANANLSGKQLEKLLEDLDRAQTELIRLQAKAGQKPPAANDPQLRVHLDVPYLGTVYVPPNKNERFLVTKLVGLNTTDKPIVIKRDEIQLNAVGKTFQSKVPSTRVKSNSYSYGNQSIYLGNLKFPAEVSIPPGQSGTIWTVFEGLPLGGNVPAMTIDLKVADKAMVIDVNESSRDLLGLTIERIGPRQSLGLLTIGGSMNMINIGSLVDELDQLTADKVTRAVIRWEKSTTRVDSQIFSWLQQAAHNAGRNQQNNNNRFPIVPAAIHELHLAQVPGQNGRSNNYSPYGPSAPQRIHKTDREAVSAALRSVYGVLSRDELIQEIEQGHPLTRAAALEGGGGRLLSSDLPLILEHTRDKSTDMQRAAIVALRHFGEPTATVALSERAKAENDPLSSVAIESLAASRFARAHSALHTLLNAVEPKLKKEIVTIVARYPRPLWSDVVYEFATSDDAQVSVVAMQALVNIGHPDLIAVLRDALHGEVAAKRDAAFKILVARTDQESEELAMDYTLAHLEKSPPTSEMLQLLQRTRDRRAVPHLLAQFNKSKSNRSTVIHTLALVGDQSVVDVFLEKYSSLTTNDKSVVLNMLRQFRAPQFRELAGEALLSTDNSLVSAACQGLQEDGSSQAVAMLIDAFDKTKNRSAWSYISNALSALGTSEARAALVKGTQSKDSNRRSYSVNALRNLRQRSPGYQYIYMGQQYDRQKKWKEAIQQYTLAAQIDPNLPEAFSGRGNALLRQEKFKEAGADLEKALKLDPFSSMSLTGLAIVRVMQDKADEGIKLVEGKRKMFENDAMYAYNVACVYGRALEAVQKDMKAKDRDKKIAQYQKQALDDLKRSLTLGFRDKNWMKKDPDLKSLHELEGFKKLLSSDPADLRARAAGQPRAAIQVQQAVEAVPIAIP